MIDNPPLVSVTIPCYNASKKLPLALASLLSQTHTNWEAIIVDDGSTDDPFHIVEILQDSRIHFHRFKENRGRAAARQQALDMARGKYLSMLDADDWIYPWKLERQVAVMEAHPGLSVLSAGMAIVDTANQIKAVRIAGTQSNKFTIYPQFSKPAMPPLAHAPAIIHMNTAKHNPYDLQFTVAEDVDFLLRILLQTGFGILSDITYAYSEFESYSKEKMILSSQSNRSMFSKYKSQYPIIAYKEMAKSLVKEQIYRVSALLQFDHYLVNRRSQPPTVDQIEQFQKAREIVYTAGKDAFTGTLYEAAFERDQGR